jgi:hypothetical protein
MFYGFIIMAHNGNLSKNYQYAWENERFLGFLRCYCKIVIIFHFDNDRLKKLDFDPKMAYLSLKIERKALTCFALSCGVILQTVRYFAHAVFSIVPPIRLKY